MIPHRRVPSLEPHVATLTFTRIVKDIAFPVVLIPELLALLSSENENVRMPPRRADSTLPLSAVHIVDFLSKKGLTRLEGSGHYRSVPVMNQTGESPHQTDAELPVDFRARRAAGRAPSAVCSYPNCR